MTREEYTRAMALGGALWGVEPSAGTIDAWWPHLKDFTLADVEDALHRLARQHAKWPSLAVIRIEARSVQRSHRRPLAAAVPSDQERERNVRYGRLIGEAARRGVLAEVHEAMGMAKKIHGDPLAAAEAMLHSLK